jgi:hypothetical protein
MAYVQLKRMDPAELDAMRQHAQQTIRQIESL